MVKINKLKLKNTNFVVLDEDSNYKNYKLSELLNMLKRKAKQVQNYQKEHEFKGDPLFNGEVWGMDAIVQILDCIE